MGVTGGDYTLVVRKEQSGGQEAWVARVSELPGCVAAEGTAEAAVQHVLSSIDAYVQVQRERGRPVPPPANDPSGRFVIRVPKWVHRELKAQAEADGISLNQHVAAILAYWAGYGVAPREVVGRLVAAGDHRPF